MTVEEQPRDEVAAEIEVAIVERDRANTAARAAMEAEQAARAAEAAAHPHLIEQQRVAKEEQEARYRAAWRAARKAHAEAEAECKRALGEGDLAAAGAAFVRWHRAWAIENGCSMALHGRYASNGAPNFLEQLALALGRLPGMIDPLTDD